MLYALAEKWKKTPAAVYKILNTTGILDDYIIAGYDMLHTQGKEYLIEDITDFVRERGVSLWSYIMSQVKELKSQMWSFPKSILILCVSVEKVKA